MNPLRDGIANAQKPQGLYNYNPLSSTGILDLPNKRIRRDYGPAGRFDAGSTGAGGGMLDEFARNAPNPGSMSRGLSTNQTQLLLYINTPRHIVPVLLPGENKDARPRTVYKGLVAGDVVFNLRCTVAMVESRQASYALSSFSPVLTFSINLPTLNYILIGLQKTVKDAMTTHLINAAWPEHIKNYGQWYRFFDAICSESSSGTSFQHMLRRDSTYMQNYLRKMQAVRDEKDRKEITLNELSDIVWKFVQSYARIGGVFIGSDEQGGMHFETGNPCAHAPTSYVGTIQVAGKHLKLRNMWANTMRGVASGSILGFSLRKVSARSINFRLSANPNTAQDFTYVIGDAPDDFLALVPTTMDAMIQESGGCPIVGSSFLQLGTINQMSKCVNRGGPEHVHAWDATACTNSMNTEVFLRFRFIRKVVRLQKLDMHIPLLRQDQIDVQETAFHVDPEPETPCVKRQSKKKARERVPVNPVQERAPVFAVPGDAEEGTVLD